ncbi:Histidine kinase [Paramicrobacterium humi]|uniref:Histidine kinase n=1 Tax=Paramicrobacterium humi TaxID=640635 RepID=A0A1H4MQU8_9MICO|nr:GAF domain-containing protein [Microbacterium humi]SEB85416.1 Histidine kinase [Microbacterium humi]
MSSDDTLDFPDLPRAELDRTLSALVDLAGQVRRTQGRLRALLRANRMVVAHLELPTVLQRIVETAVDLVDAQYGALGVLGADGTLEQLVQVGMSPEEVDAVGHLPVGVGLVGALTEEGRPIRLRHVAEDPRAAGFPAGHPPMESFLGVPIRVRGEVYGNLYLANQSSGEFSADDEQLIASLAGTAGFAIENARLFAETQRRQAWATASAEVTSALFTPQHDDMTPFIAARVLAATESARLSIAREGDPIRTFTATPDGGAEELPGVPSSPLVRHVLENRGPYLTDADEAALGPTMVLPLSASPYAPGAVVISRQSQATRFTAAELDMAADFAGRIDLAKQLAEARVNEQRMLLLEDRARIARDLHDHVIQQLFATGLELQATLPGLDTAAAEPVGRAVTTLDDTIARIRTVIFALSRSREDSPTIRDRVLAVVGELAHALPPSPQVAFAGPVDLVVTNEIADDVVAVTREALTNIVRHASAHNASLTLTAADGSVTVEVVDDGVGAAGAGRRSGLANLSARARRRRGTCAFESRPGETRLRWSVPAELPKGE